MKLTACNPTTRAIRISFAILGLAFIALWACKRLPALSNRTRPFRPVLLQAFHFPSLFGSLSLASALPLKAFLELGAGVSLWLAATDLAWLWQTRSIRRHGAYINHGNWLEVVQHDAAQSDDTQNKPDCSL